MAGELGIQISADLSTSFFSGISEGKQFSALDISQALDINITNGDIVDISVEAYSEFSMSQSLNQDSIYENLKGLSPDLAEKYLAVRDLLASISGEAATAFDKALSSVMEANNIRTESTNTNQNNNIAIEAFSSLKANVTVEDEQGQQYNIEISLSGSISVTSSQEQTKDPILIDLDNNGIEFSNKKDFDIDEDGQNEQVSWVSDNDGVLFVDYNNDSKLSSMNELFGDTDGFANGVEKLLHFDDNKDGVINSLDSIFEKLKIEKGDGSILTMDNLNVKNITVDGESISLNSENSKIAGGDYLFSYNEYLV